MPNSMLSQYPLSFDSFPPSYQSKTEPYSDFSPSLYSPLDIDELGTDFTTDSAQSPGSPLSPVLTGMYALPQSNPIAWDKIENSSGLFKAEPIDDTILSSIPLRNMSLSPAINPLDLTNLPVDDVLFGHEGINDNQPLFQTQFPLAATRTQPNIMLPPPQQPTRAPTTKAPTRPTPSTNSRYSRRNLKRKPSSEEDDEQLSQRSSASPPPSARRSSKSSETPATGPKKTAHNMIEKRYRNNLNDKIAALRDAVPALRVMVQKLESAQGENGSEGDEGEDDVYGAGVVKAEDTEDLGGLAPAQKLNKATILGKATEYILHLERKNRNLAMENAALMNRVEGFEMLVMSRGGGNGMWA